MCFNLRKFVALIGYEAIPGSYCLEGHEALRMIDKKLKMVGGRLYTWTGALKFNKE